MNVTIDEAIKTLTEAKAKIGGDKCLILCLRDSQLEYADVDALVVVDETAEGGESQMVLVEVDHPALREGRPGVKTMIAFVIQTGDSVAFAQCGLRVSIHENMKELAEDVLAFFVDAEGRENAELDELAHNVEAIDGVEDPGAFLPVFQKSLEAAIIRNAEGRDWSVYSKADGYILFD